MGSGRITGSDAGERGLSNRPSRLSPPYSPTVDFCERSGVDFFPRLRYGEPVTSDGLFYDAAVLKVIRVILVSRGIRAEQDLEDAIGEVVLACIEHVRGTGRPPENVPAAIAVARPIAYAQGIDAARKRARRRKSNQGPTAEADEHAREKPPSIDPVDEERMLAAIRKALKDDQIEALSDVGAGVAQADLAADSRTSPAAMRKRVQKSREKALGALSAKGYLVAGGFAALLAGSIAVYVVSEREPGRVTAPHPPRDRNQELAAEQRRIATELCKEGKWDDCEKVLDVAARLDAEGDRESEVTALREAIAAGRRGMGASDGGGRGDGGGGAR
jgi:DNA-directed RNA polymerase specialized sigma24 family protein